MKTILFLFIFICSVSAENTWIKDPEKALKSAKENGKAVIIDFYAEWCGPCKMMDNTTLKDEIVIKELNSFTLIKVDGDKFKEYVNKFQVSGFPTFIMLNTHGETVNSFSGYKNSTDFLKWLNQYKEQAQSGKSLAKLNENDFKFLEMLKQEKESKAAFEALTEQVFLNSYKKNKLIIELNNIAKENPKAFIKILNHESLSCRLLVSQIYLNIYKEKFEYDPWETPEKRQAQIDKLMELWK